MLVLFTGSRTWPSPAFVRGVMIQLRSIIGDFTALHGGARGLDTFVDVTARLLHLPDPLVERPDYNRYPGYLAPKIRNTRMLDLRPDMVVGFRTSGPSSGTDDCLYKAINIYRIPALVFTGPLDRVMLSSTKGERTPMPKAKSDQDRLIDFSYRATNTQLEEAIKLFRAALSARNAAKSDKPKPVTRAANKPKSDAPATGEGGDAQ